jgi:cellulose synthase/poly-beta-1,6-N-acetylglucosamine synthase-like glycosyltransferase
LDQIAASRSKRAALPSAKRNSEIAAPFVSIHVATHDEPPALVIDTLNALKALDYPEFEVIVIDNNTVDPLTWMPVQQHVKQLGPRFRFIHADCVQGAKAGALNIALSEIDAKARFVAIIDADYQVNPEFLALATNACAGLDFVQFPQSYRQSEGAETVCDELSDYFSIYPSAANRTSASLLTGTLSLISVSALREVGGWPTGSITEDAELGVALWKGGARGRYVDQAVGTGLLPLDLAGLRQQRSRWAAGNAQTLIHALREPSIILRPGGVAIAAQLTAWTGFLAVPLIVLCLVAALRLGGIPYSGAIVLAQTIATITLAFGLASIGLRAIVTGRVKSMSVTLAMVWTSSFSWLPALVGKRLLFRRTPKLISLSVYNAVSIDSMASLIAFSVALIFASQGSFVTAFVLVISAAGLVSGLQVDRILKAAGKAFA